MSVRSILAALLALGAGSAQAAAWPDVLVDLAPGLSATVIARAGDTLADGTRFASNNDLTAYFPVTPNEGYLMVGHELGWGKEGVGGRFTRFALRDGRVVSSQTWVSGMHLNCAGGVTPWGTILSGEEFPNKAMGEFGFESKRYREGGIHPDEAIASFGWIYEISPLGATPAGQAQRRTGMGRFSHESAAVHGDRTVYLTEDFEGGHLYKFIADKPRDMGSGALYAYDRAKRRWLALKDMVNARAEATRLGATPFNRLEDVKVGPDGKIYFAETGDPTVGDQHGRVWTLDPKTNTAEVFLEGDGTRLSSPDNLEFDRQGRLYICEDQFGHNLKRFGANEVLRVNADKSLTRVLAVRPNAEPTGPSFSPDFKRLYVSVMDGAKSAVIAVDGF